MPSTTRRTHLERRRQRNVLVNGPRAVDVVLEGPDLVGPRPLVEVAGPCQVVEAAVPEHGSLRQR